MKKNLLRFLFPAILVTISLFLCFKNYSPGTYLLGWDSLHPEFNFPEAFRRVWEGVWRAEQGVGAIAAHSHMADLPRVIFLWLESFILPASFLRYSYIFLCLIIGPLGIYFFLKYVFQKEKESAWTHPAAFLGALFYLLNLGTLQNFYVPFEMFPAAFAFTPWLFFAGLKFLREGGKKNLIFFAVIVILSSPMAYAAALWYATIAGLLIFLTSYVLFSPAKKVKIKRLLGLGVVALFLNLYWILPNIYSITNQSGIISNAAVNRLFSQEAFLRNRNYGDFKDILLQKNFLFDWRNFDFVKNQFGDLLRIWTLHLQNPNVIYIGYILVGIAIAGLAMGLIKKEKVSLAFFPTLVFVLFFLININPPTGGIYAYFYDHFGLFREGLRMPFTKFSILYELSASFYFGYFAFVILIARPRFLTFIKYIFLGTAVAGLIYFMLPAFNSWLIGPNVRKSLPDEYLQAFNWFNNRSDGRTALMPMNTRYGWDYRSWGYEGSGFLTYGIAGPLLYRDFDRWSKYNQDFFQEASFALYNDQASFENILKKFQVKYILMDESVINPGGIPDIILNSSNHIKEVQKFGFLTIYETDYDMGNNFISAPKEEFGEYLPKEPKVVVGEPIIKEDFSVNRGFPSACNCDLRKIGKALKSNSKEGISYRAEWGGVSCDYLNYPGLKYGQAYVLRIAGENKEGRSLKIYLYNDQTKRMELEELLPDGIFDQTYFVYLKKVDGGGYILNLETRSFGRIASENLLTKVEFYPVEYNYADGPIPVANNLVIEKVQKYGTWAYKVEAGGSGLMQLGQGYESGWVAFQIRDSRFQILTHIKVNGWANGWTLPTSIGPQVSNIYIVFWPQLLEWGGGILGIITLLVLILNLKNGQVLTKANI